MGDDTPQNHRLNLCVVQQRTLAWVSGSSRLFGSWVSNFDFNTTFFFKQGRVSCSGFDYLCCATFPLDFQTASIFVQWSTQRSSACHYRAQIRRTFWKEREEKSHKRRFRRDVSCGLGATRPPQCGPEEPCKSHHKSMLP